MLKRILQKVAMLVIATTVTLTFTSCEEVTSQVPFLAKEAEPEVLISDLNIVFMFSQVNKNDLTILTTIDAMRDEFGFLSETIILDDDSKITSSLRKVVENKADLVVGYGQGMAIVFDLFEDTYPDTKFVVIDGVAQDEDIKSISFDTDAVAYALGVMVGTAFTGNNDFGYIGDFENDNNLNYKVGYIKGLQSINKNASIDIDYTESASNYQTAYDLTTYYQSIGVKFVMNATNPTISKGIYQACIDLAEEGKYIYTNSILTDDTTSSSPYIVTGITKDYVYATELAVNDFIEGKFISTNTELTAEHDTLQLLDVTSQNANYSNTDILNDNAIKAGRKALDDIKNRNIIL